jgi:4-amino-4-deoxy-L-arabinose transferase-like glycosyltransferase
MEIEGRATPSRWAIPALAGLYVAIALPLAARLDIWIDEAYTLATTGQGARHALHQALFFEQQPPLYFVLLSLWRTLDGGVLFARLFSVLCGLATLFAVAALSRRWLPEAHPAWLTALAGLNPFFFYAVLEIRTYALALLLSALLLLLLHDGYLAPEPRKGARVGFGLVAVAALYTQYYLGFLLVAGAVALLATRRWRPLRDYLLAMAAVAACFAPMVWLIPRQVSAQGAGERASVLEGVQSLAGRIQEYAWPTEGLPAALRPALRVGFLLALVLLVLIRRRAVRRREVAVWTLTAAAVLLFLAARVGITGPHLMQPRHTAALYLPALLTVFSAVLLLAEPRRRWALRIWTGALILLTAASMIKTYRALARIGDWARVANFLERNVRPGEPILVLTAEAAIPLKHYYRGPNPLLPLPAEEDFKVYDTRELELRSEWEIDAAMVRMPGDRRSVWVVTHPLHPDWLGIDYGFGVLEGYLAKRYRVERSVRFYGTRVRHFTTRP